MAISGPTVLYVEDEETDSFLMRHAFARRGLEAALRIVKDGKAAQDYLSGTGAYGDRQMNPLPAVVLLDLNLPELHGFEVLKWIRAHPVHASMPVVIFTSSDHEEDRARAQLTGATEFLRKPGSPLKFGEVVTRLNEQWLHVTPKRSDISSPTAGS